MTIMPCRDLTDRIEEILGYRACSFTRKDIAPPPRRKWGNGGGNGSNGKGGNGRVRAAA